jgi:ankyrin repeat protein
MATPERATRTLPDRPNLQHLKDQAKDLFKAGGAASLTDAQFKVAREYGFDSWPKLEVHVELLQETGQLKEAIDAEDLQRVIEMMTKNPALHRAPLGYNKNGPLTWVAECRTVKGSPSQVRLDMARWMIKHGSDIHQGGDGPLMRASMNDRRIPMVELLVAHGADVNAHWNGDYPIILTPCECLAPGALRWLLQHGARIDAHSARYGSAVAMVIGTYGRGTNGKHACLEILAEYGPALPDTPCLAFHRGNTGLLETHLKKDPGLLSRRFSEAEIFPPELGLKPGDGLHLTPIDGATLLHLAIEYDELDIAAWLLEKGADANARAAVDAEGFGGHTPLFHAVISMGLRDESKALLLLKHGADPNARATIRKQLRDVGDPEKERMFEFRDVTPIAFAKRFQEPRFVSQTALELLEAHGGME